MQFGIKKTRLAKALLLILLLSSVFVGCARAPSRGWCGPTVSDGILYVGSIKGDVLVLENIYGTDTPGVKATFTLESQPSSLSCGARVSKAMSIYGTPWVAANGLVYVGDYSGYVYAFDANASGDISWIHKFKTGGAIVGSPVVVGDTVYIGSSDGKLYALNLDLSENWTFKTGDKIWSTPWVEGKVVYIGSSDRNLYAIDAESGKEIWRFETQGAILSTPLVSNNTVYIGSCDRKFYAVKAATEDERLAAAAGEPTTPTREGVFDEAGNWYWTQALAYDDRIYVGNLDHKVYALNATNIENKLGEFETQGMVRTPPVSVNGTIVIGSQDGNIYILDPEDLNNGSKSVPLGAPILAPLCADYDKDLVFAHAQDGNHILYAIAVPGGEKLWEFKTSG